MKTQTYSKAEAHELATLQAKATGVDMLVYAYGVPHSFVDGVPIYNYGVVPRERAQAWQISHESNDQG